MLNMFIYIVTHIMCYVYQHNDRDTPTSSGPNSFYKGKMGFSDPRAGYKRYNDDD